MGMPMHLQLFYLKDLQAGASGRAGKPYSHMGNICRLTNLVRGIHTLYRESWNTSLR